VTDIDTDTAVDTSADTAVDTSVDTAVVASVDTAVDIAVDIAGVDADADGRRLRRERNRDAVVDALLALFHEGNLQPSSVEIAERAGLSPRSLFRYFDDIDDLSRAAIERQQTAVWPLVVVELDGAEPLDDRVAAVVGARAQLFEAIGNVGRVARLRAPFQPVVAGELARGRSFLRRQLREVFAPELTAMGEEQAAGVLAALDVLCSFESYHLLRDDQALSRMAATTTVARAVSALLHAASTHTTTEDASEETAR
jgi:AcrR family transcriptional regulator